VTLHRIIPFLFVLLGLVPSAVAAGRELGPRGGGPTSYGAREPLTAFAGGRFLTVWNESMGWIGYPLMGTLSDGTGKRVSPIAFPIEGAHGNPVQIVGVGDGFAMFELASGHQSHLTRLDLEGRVTSTRPLALRSFVNLRVAWNGTHFLAAMRRSDGPVFSAEVVLLDENGTIVHGPLPLRDDMQNFAIVSADDGFTLIATGSSGVFAYRVTNGGAMTEDVIEGHSGTMRPWSPAVSTTANGDVIAVWSSGVYMQSQIKSAVLTGDGSVRDLRVLADLSTSPVTALELMRAGDTHVLLYKTYEGGLATLRLGASAPLIVTEGVLDASAASNGSTIFVAYTPSTIYPLRIDSLSVGADGLARNHEVVSFSRTRQTQPALGAGDGRFLAAWTDIAGEAAFVRAASVGLDATPRTDHVVAPAYLASPDLAWSGSEYLAVSVRNQSLLASRVAWDGTPIDAEPFAIGQTTNVWWDATASVAWTGGQWMVVWPKYDRLVVVTVTRGGAVSAPLELIPNSTLPADSYRQIRAFATASNGTTTLLTWTEEQSPFCGFFPPCPGGPSRTFVTRVTAGGQLLDASAVELPVADTLSIATSGDEFLVLGDATASAIEATAAPRLLASRELLNWPAQGDVAWDGTSYVAALRYRGIRWHLSVTHLDREARPIGTARGTETLPPDLERPPSIASVVPSFALVAVQEGDARDGARAVVYEERTMNTLPPAPGTPRNLRVTATPDRKFEVTWDPPADGEVELYHVEGLTAGGAWVWVGSVAGNAPLRLFSPFGIVRVRAFNAGGASPDALLPPRRRSARP
jgi:hypothetical protein